MIKLVVIFTVISIFLISQILCYKIPKSIFITAGHEAIPHIAPYIVSLQIKNEHQCGGTILNNNWILTAAHCLPDSQIQQITINAGYHDLKEHQSNIIQKRKIDFYKRHKLYIGGINPYDIALIYFKQSLIWTKYVKPIKLTKSNIIPNGKADVYGWGSISTTQNPLFPNKLQTAEMEILKFSDCEKRLKKLNPKLELHETNFCANTLGISVCKSDSGGPLVNKNNELIGVISWGVIPCANPPDAPSVFVRVSAFIDWIQKVQNEHHNV